MLKGVATITAKATQDLSSFNLDFRGLKVRTAKVGGRAATWRRKGAELTIVPRASLRRGRAFTAVIAYDGKPGPVREGSLGDEDGFMPTDDGALVAGEPHSASTWYPANEHPRDKASYSFRISVPRGRGGDRQRRPGRRRRPGRTVDLALGGERADGRLPLDGHDRAVRALDADDRWTPVRGRHRPRPAQARQAAHRRALRRDRHRAARLSAPAAQDRRPGGRREALVLRQPRHAAGRRPLLRGSAHGRRRRLDDAARRAGPHRRPDDDRLQRAR